MAYRGVNVGGRVVIGTRQHRDDREEDRLQVCEGWGGGTPPPGTWVGVSTHAHALAELVTAPACLRGCCAPATTARGRPRSRTCPRQGRARWRCKRCRLGRLHTLDLAAPARAAWVSDGDRGGCEGLHDAPLGCHISDVNFILGGSCGYSLGKLRRALKKPPSLRRGSTPPPKKKNTGSPCVRARVW